MPCLLRFDSMNLLAIPFAAAMLNSRRNVIGIVLDRSDKLVAEVSVEPEDGDSYDDDGDDDDDDDGVDDDSDDVGSTNSDDGDDVW